MAFDDFHIRMLEGEDQDIQRNKLQPFSLKGATMKQEEALRNLAEQSGFKNMRGFNKFMEASHVTYYDLIKVASP